MSLAFEAMMFAREVHKDQKRKYTGNSYVDHLAEVAGVTASVERSEVAIAVAWLHDSMEDQGVSQDDIRSKCGQAVASGVLWLSDLETGNRKERKRLSRERLANAPGWVQTIKCADLISNTSRIVQHDHDFAKVYLEEKRLLLEVLTKADRRLWEVAKSLCE